MRLRLDRAPASAWMAAAAAVLAILLALMADPLAAALLVFAGVAAVFAWREMQRTTISARDEQIELMGLAELAHLLEALPDPALLVGADGRIAGSNAAARSQLKFEAAGLFLTAILRHPDVLEAVQAAIHDGATRTIEYETSDQVDQQTRCYVAPIAWGQERAALLVFHDQTARINTERMRADFLANASHELRTPLASLTLALETISGPARDNAEERNRFIKLMQVQADRMRRLIDDLLSLSRIELDEHVPPEDRADLSQVAREVVDAIAPVAAEKGVKLALTLPSAPARVVGERFQLAQVVQNLIDNAIKYTPNGGTVAIEIGAAQGRDDAMAQAGRRWPEAGRIAMLTPPPANRAYAFVRVEDAGPGIARRFLPRLGTRFFRVERELGAEKGGTGLGLAIVKHIINRHRGGFLVESQQGKGSAFAAYVELAED
ncbi:ATP-binding protein [Terricaulis sp.]|uniref:ATP-binding protein n=1 Tax=Terricaulis sp. TaxID=2768686 RepID=UPI0037841439